MFWGNAAWHSQSLSAGISPRHNGKLSSLAMASSERRQSPYFVAMLPGITSAYRLGDPQHTTESFANSQWQALSDVRADVLGQRCPEYPAPTGW